jgi:hypothetical protein
MCPIACPPGFFIGHEHIPDPMGIEVVAPLINQRLGIGRQDARDEALT